MHVNNRHFIKIYDAIIVWLPRDTVILTYRRGFDFSNGNTVSDPLDFSLRRGDADLGQLNFYDAARFQYGAARFVYTLEYFWQETYYPKSLVE